MIPPDNLHVLTTSFNQLHISPAAAAYTALDGTVHTLTRLTSLASQLCLEPKLSLIDLFHIAHWAQSVRQTNPSKMTYLKKDNKTLKTTLIIDETATYILLKTHMGDKRVPGGEKYATFALRVPTDATENATRVCQLVSHDTLDPFLREQQGKEFSLQATLSQDGICPKVFGLFDYIKTSKTGEHIHKRTAFVEAFDYDLCAFDPLGLAGSGIAPLTVLQIIAVAKSIAQHLQVLHSKNIVHFDIGLENIGVCYDHEKNKIIKVFLTDFGLSFKLNEEQPYNASMYGHIPVTGPEFFRKDVITDYTKCDIYALGVVLSMLAISPDSDVDPEFEPQWIGNLTKLEELVKKEKQPPTAYTDETAEILQMQEAYRPISERASGAINTPLDQESFLKAIISICLHPDPAKRPSAKELIGHCEKISE